MKLDYKLIKGNLIEVYPKIFAVSIKNDYDRAMLFCRYQEFYESPFKEIRGKHFSLEYYMWVYTKQRKSELFTYPRDWSGYNIPSGIVEKALDVFYYRNTPSPYDTIMKDIYFQCENHPLKSGNPRSKWYLLGADSYKSQTMDHEIAHGMYYTNKSYKKSVKELISTIKSKDYTFLCKNLIKLGYANDKKILDDEIQAFLSTGLYKTFDTKEIKKYSDDFVNNFIFYIH